MWFFFRRRERPLPDAETRKPRPLSFARIVQGFGDFQDLQVHDAALKFWLPEPAEQALVEFCKLAEQSRSEWLRQFFVVYAYGLLALTVIDDRCPGFFRDQRGIRHQRAADRRAVRDARRLPVVVRGSAGQPSPPLGFLYGPW